MFGKRLSVDGREGGVNVGGRDGSGLGCIDRPKAFFGRSLSLEGMLGHGDIVASRLNASAL